MQKKNKPRPSQAVIVWSIKILQFSAVKAMVTREEGGFWGLSEEEGRRRGGGAKGRERTNFAH